MRFLDYAINIPYPRQMSRKKGTGPPFLPRREKQPEVSPWGHFWLFLSTDVNQWTCPLYLDQSLIKHRVGYFYEAGDVGAFYVVDILAFLAVLDARLVDADHDLMQLLVHFLPGP